MRRLRRLLEHARAVVPPLLGVLSVVLLFAGLFAIDLLVGADLRVFGVSEQATQQMVFQRYGSLIIRHQEHVLLWFLGVAAALGLVVQVLYKLWERCGAWPRHQAQAVADTPPGGSTM